MTINTAHPDFRRSVQSRLKSLDAISSTRRRGARKTEEDHPNALLLARLAA
jgi:hypothetical protein